MLTDLVILAAVVAVAGALALWWRSAQGRVRAVDRSAPRLTDDQRAALDAPAGAALLLEFTAPGCTPCAAAAQVLDGVVAQRRDAALVLCDVGEHVDIARVHGVLRAPTTLVVAPGGEVLHRISGVPDPTVVHALLDEADDQPLVA